MIIIASDDRDDLLAEVARVEHSIYPTWGANGRISRSGVVIIFKESGATLPQPLTGHEHFGFLDGVSQPGLRGRISDEPTDVLTFRQNPNNRDQGKPGQDLLWPGEFVFGYPGQDPNSADIVDPGPISEAGPAWAKDGSFVVFRRLRQDVQAFRDFEQQMAFQLGISPDLFGAKLVGRWASGAPILRAPEADNRALADDDCSHRRSFHRRKAIPPDRSAHLRATFARPTRATTHPAPCPIRRRSRPKPIESCGAGSPLASRCARSLSSILACAGCTS